MPPGCRSACSLSGRWGLKPTGCSPTPRATAQTQQLSAQASHQDERGAAIRPGTQRWHRGAKERRGEPSRVSRSREAEGAGGRHTRTGPVLPRILVRELGDGVTSGTLPAVPVPPAPRLKGNNNSTHHTGCFKHEIRYMKHSEQAWQAGHVHQISGLVCVHMCVRVSGTFKERDDPVG